MWCAPARSNRPLRCLICAILGHFSQRWRGGGRLRHEIALHSDGRWAHTSKEAIGKILEKNTQKCALRVHFTVRDNFFTFGWRPDRIWPEFFSKKAPNHQNSWEFLTTRHLSELSGVLFKPMSGTESALKLQLTYKIPVSDYDMEFLLLLNWLSLVFWVRLRLSIVPLLVCCGA